MASISKEPAGRRSIQFVAGDGRRRSIRLGKVTQRMAEAVKLRVELLSAAIQSGHATDDETARWLATIDHRLNAKLAAVGLVARRQSATLAAFLDSYVKSRGDVGIDGHRVRTHAALSDRILRGHAAATGHYAR